VAGTTKEYCGQQQDREEVDRDQAHLRPAASGHEHPKQAE
jgi:hypothetical protein